MSSSNASSSQRGSGSNSTTGQWLIKSDSDQVRGPYSTEAVNKMILEGICSGQEEIAVYPSGEWVAIVKQSEFYEALLESLENPVERDEKKTQKIEAETVIRPNSKSTQSPPSNISSQSSDSLNEKTLVEHEVSGIHTPQSIEELNEVLKKVKSTSLQPFENGHSSQATSVTPVYYQNEQKAQLDRQLNQTEKIKNQIQRKLFPILLIALILGGASLYYYLDQNQNAKNLGWTLSAPSKKTDPLDKEEILKLKKQTISIVRSGVINKLPQAQNFLIQILEADSNDLEAMGLLCGVHDLMWPYTKQSTADLKAIATLVRSSRSINPFSTYANVCQSLFLISKGQSREAITVTSHAIDSANDGQIVLPFLYLIQAESFEDNDTYLTAESYYSEAERLFPGWIWPMFGVARMQMKAGKTDEAIATYSKILKINPEYKAALFGLATIYSKADTNAEQSIKYFNEGFDIDQMLPRNFHVDALKEYIKILLSKNNREQALAVAQSALKISPKDKNIKDIVVSLGGELNQQSDGEISDLIQTGDQYFRKQDYITAQAQYRAAFTLDKTNANLALKIAKCFWNLRQSNEAINWVDKAITIAPNQVSGYTLKADYLMSKYNFIDAEKTLAIVKQKDPNNYDMLKSFSRLEFKKNNLKNALVMAEKAYKQYDADVNLIALISEINIGLYNQMRANQAPNEQTTVYFDNAKKYALKALDLEPNLPEAQIIFAKYRNLAEGSTRAEEYLKELIRNFQYTPEYRIALAELFESQEKYKSALDQYLPLANLDPKNFKVKLGIAKCYRRMGQLDLAQKYFLDAAVIDYNDAEPMFSLAQIQFEKGLSLKRSYDIEQALLKFDKVSKINPNYPKVYFSMAVCLVELGQIDQASDYLKMEKSKNPNLSDTYSLQGLIYKKQGKFKDCATEYTQAANLKLTAEPFVNAAQCYRLNGDMDMSEIMLEKAKSREPNNIEMMREYGFIYKSKGDTGLAAEYFNKYLEMAPNAVDRNEIERNLY